MAVEFLEKWCERISCSAWKAMLFAGLGTSLGTALAIPVAAEGVRAIGLFSPPKLLLYSWVATLCAAAAVLLITLKPYRVRVLTVIIFSSVMVTVIQLSIENGATASMMELLRPALLGLLLPWCFAVGAGRLIFSRRHMTWLPILAPLVGFGLCLPLTIALSRTLDALRIPTPESVELAIYSGWLAAFVALAIYQMQKPFRSPDSRKRRLYAQILRPPPVLDR